MDAECQGSVEWSGEKNSKILATTEPILYRKQLNKKNNPPEESTIQPREQN